MNIRVAEKNLFEGKIVSPKRYVHNVHYTVRKLLHEYLYEILGGCFCD